MNAAEMEAIIGGYHRDAFSVLGPHPVEVKPPVGAPKAGKAPKPVWEVRAFLPQAQTLTLLKDGAEIPMEKVHPRGFFVAELKHNPGVYQFRLEDYHGGVRVMEDPFRFGTIITEFDLHLHSQGTLYEAWKSFGAHVLDLAGIQGDPAGPGFQKIIIKPALVGDLTWVKASYQSIRGEIVSEWTHDAKGLTMNVIIPIGATATIHVPAAQLGLVKEGGQPAVAAPGVKFLRVEDGAVVFAVGSGNYHFSVAPVPAPAGHRPSSG